ncbi:MAG: hypothetical protein L0229_08605 [Blastocatellia bacterium]|nr:hypothetical protein [Blastocatellia bacterium]
MDKKSIFSTASQDRPRSLWIIGLSVAILALLLLLWRGMDNRLFYWQEFLLPLSMVVLCLVNLFASGLKRLYRIGMISAYVLLIAHLLLGIVWLIADVRF